MIATSSGLPASISRCLKAFNAGLRRAAARAPMNNAARPQGLPPPMKLLPFHRPDCPVTGQSRRAPRSLCGRARRAPQPGDQGSRDHRPYARHPGEQIFLFAARPRRAAHGTADILIECGEFLFERLDDTRDALLQKLTGKPLPRKAGGNILRFFVGRIPMGA
jgi:hypothetical protein